MKTIKTKSVNDAYADGWERIFGKKKPEAVKPQTVAPKNSKVKKPKVERT